MRKYSAESYYKTQNGQRLETTNDGVEYEDIEDGKLHL